MNSSPLKKMYLLHNQKSKTEKLRKDGHSIASLTWHPLLLFIVAGIILTTTGQHVMAVKAHSNEETRDPKLWPFASTSIWNMPIGSNATYVQAGFGAAGHVTGDDDYFIITSSSDPLRDVYAPGDGSRCSGTQHLGNGPMLVPDSLIVPDVTPNSTPNNASAFLQPDGRSLIQLQPLARCTAGGNVYGWIACGDNHTEDIEGDGICGAHFGSGLSSIGGMIRKGELTGQGPIRHALQLEIWMAAYGYYSSSLPGYRWPARRADSYASSNYCTLDPCKSHPNPSLVQGSLLAIPSWVDKDSLGLSTDAAKKMFDALQNYGGYVVDDTYWDDYQIGVEVGVQDEFAQAYGYGFGGNAGPFYDDVNKLFQALQIVDNNGPDNIGGGGTLRAPMAPPFA